MLSVLFWHKVRSQSPINSSYEILRTKVVINFPIHGTCVTSMDLLVQVVHITIINQIEMTLAWAMPIKETS